MTLGDGDRNEKSYTQWMGVGLLVKCGGEKVELDPWPVAEEVR